MPKIARAALPKPVSRHVPLHRNGHRSVNMPRAARRPVGLQTASAPVEAEIIAVIEGKRGAWSAANLAELLGCSNKHIYELAKSGRMPHLRIDGMIRFDPSATAAWLRERFIAA